MNTWYKCLPFFRVHPLFPPFHHHQALPVVTEQILKLNKPTQTQSCDIKLPKYKIEKLIGGKKMCEGGNVTGGPASPGSPLGPARLLSFPVAPCWTDITLSITATLKHP